MSKLNQLRAAYSTIEKIDPESAAFKNLTAYLDKRSDGELKELRDAKIKWISMLANNRLITRGVK